MEKPRLLYIAPRLSSFVQNDIDALSGDYDVEFQAFDARPKWKLPFLLIRQLLVLLSRRQPEVWVSRFAGFHSVLPSLVGKYRSIRHFVILGGTDCNTLPEIGYGNALRFFLRQATRLTLRRAFHLLPLTEALVKSEDRFNRPPGRMGYRNNYRGVSTPYTVIPLGVDSTRFRWREGSERQPLSFVTICSGLESERRRRLKGLDLFIQLAHALPEASFLIVGGEQPDGFDVPDNVCFEKEVPHSRLPDLLMRFKFYVQLSRSEGFSNALLEAMACGCIPIVSDVGCMPDLVKGFGVVIGSDEVHNLGGVVRDFMAVSNAINTEEISAYVVLYYDITLRSSALVSALNKSEQ